MSTRKRTVATGMNAIAEYAQDLMEATTDAAGEKVAEARERLGDALEHGKALYGQARKGAIRRAKTADKFIRRNPYAALSIGVAAGILIGFLMRSGDRD